jgi:hypothetical protein
MDSQRRGQALGALTLLGGVVGPLAWTIDKTLRQ